MLGSYYVAAAAASKPSSFNPTTLIFIVIIIAAFYLLMIRPQQRRKQQAQQQANTLQPGARVVTTAGMYATVVDVDGDDVILEVAPGTEVRYMKRAVMNVVSTPDTVDEPVEDEAPAEDYASDPADDIVDGTAVDDMAEPDAADAEETAYEQATGSKKD
jgi:preprotein translocase subunit YajC